MCRYRAVYASPVAGRDVTPDVARDANIACVTAVIRKATVADVDLVVSSRLDFLRAVRSTEILDGEAQLAAKTRSFVRAEFEAERLHTWIAEQPGEFLGIVSLLLWSRPPRPGNLRVADGYIINMYVRPDRQRQGIGGLLLAECLQNGRELGVARFVLHSTDEGRHLYESIGFRPTQNWMTLATPAAEQPTAVGW